MKLSTHAIYIGLLLAAVGWIVFTMDTTLQPSPQAGQLGNPRDVQIAEVTAATAQPASVAPAQSSDGAVAVQSAWSESERASTIHAGTSQSPANETGQAELEEIVQGNPSLAETMSNYTEQIHRRFSNESINQQWAYQRETELEDIFYVEETLRDLDVDSVECRQTLCQIQLNKNTDDMFRRFMDIQRVIIEKGLSSTSRSYLIEDENTNEYRVFIQR